VTTTARQATLQRRVEGLVALAAPTLDLLLSAGERISRIVGPEDEYYPIRSPEESMHLPGATAGDEHVAPSALRPGSVDPG